MHRAWARPRVLTLLALALVSCQPTATTSPEPTGADPSPRGAAAAPSPALRAALDDATTGVEDPALAAVLHEHWALHLRDSPVQATRLGVHDYDDRLWDSSPLAIERRRVDRGKLIAHLEEIDEAGLSAADQLTRALLLSQLHSDERREVCRDSEWNAGVHSNPVTAALSLHEGFRLATRQDGANLVARYRAVGNVVDQEIALLASGAKDGLFASQRTLARVVELVDRQLAQPVEEWAMLEPSARALSSWSEDARAQFARDLRAAVTEEVVPAFGRYRDFVRDQLVPNARGPANPGVGALPMGAQCYEALIAHHTTVALTAEEIHAIGLEEIARIDGEISALGRRQLGTKTLAATIARLRDDPALYFGSAQEVEAAAVDGLAKAKEAMPQFFGRLPQADCVVRRVPDFEAPSTHIGYYEPPHADGSKPGEYYVNVYAPTTRPRFEARVLAVHESIPGHHLQIAIAQELADLPAFRRHSGYSSYVEGWALYTERLAEQMGLYETDLDRMGMLSFDAWRAGRLVVDTGIHAMGWTREQAEAFLLEHTALTATNIANEVDRYIGWPGQALGYKIGQRHLLQLRDEAKAALGDGFDLPRFHDVVLGGGPMTLELLSARVRAWIAAGGN